MSWGGLGGSWEVLGGSWEGFGGFGGFWIRLDSWFLGVSERGVGGGVRCGGWGLGGFLTGTVQNAHFGVRTGSRYDWIVGGSKCALGWVAHDESCGGLGGGIAVWIRWAGCGRFWVPGDLVFTNMASSLLQQHR